MKYLLTILLGVLFVSGSVEAATILFPVGGGTGWGNLQANTILLGNGTGRIATTTQGTAGQILSLVSGVPSWVSTTTFSGGLTYSGGNVTNTLTAGDGLTRTVDDIDCDTASGSVFGCLASADWTTFNDKVSGTRALTVAGTANQITSSAGAQDLSADRTWTLSLPAHVIFPGSLFVASATTTNATTTDSQYITSLATAAGAFLAIDPTGRVIATSSPSGGSGVTDIGPTGQTSDGPTVTFATSSGATNGLTPSLVITGSGDTQTFTSSISGTLTVPGGGTGVATLTGLAKGNGASAFTAAVDGTDFTLIDASTCTNQLFSAVTAAGAFTCSSINNAQWSGTDLSVANGGTGQSTFTSSQLLYGNGTNALSSVATGTVSAGNGISISATIYALLNAASIAVDATANFAWTGVHDFGAAVIEMTNGTGPTVDAVGEFALDTTNNQFIFATSTAAGAPGVIPVNYYASFAYATTSWVGTTTLPLGPAYIVENWVGIQCFTDTGTVQVSVNDGTNRMNFMNASTTVGTVGLTTNSQFTAGEKRYVDIGTPASSPTRISCTISKTYGRL